MDGEEVISFELTLQDLPHLLGAPLPDVESFVIKQLTICHYHWGGQ